MNGGKYNRFSYTVNGELHPPHQNQDILQTMFNVPLLFELIPVHGSSYNMTQISCEYVEY